MRARMPGRRAHGSSPAEVSALARAFTSARVAGTGAEAAPTPATTSAAARSRIFTAGAPRPPGASAGVRRRRRGRRSHAATSGKSPLRSQPEPAYQVAGWPFGVRATISWLPAASAHVHDRRGVDHEAAAEPAVVAVVGQVLPRPHDAALAVDARHDALGLADAGGPRDVAVRRVEALEPVEVAAGVEGDALHLGHLQPRLLPLGVGDLEDDPEGAAREHARGAEVLRDGERPVDHQAAAAAAAGPAGGVEVAPLAVVAVVVVDEVPVVQDEAPGALAPRVDRAARERLLRERLQGRAVDAEGDPVVLPREVVLALAHEAAVDAVVLAARLAWLGQRTRTNSRVSPGPKSAWNTRRSKTSSPFSSTACARSSRPVRASVTARRGEVLRLDAPGEGGGRELHGLRRSGGVEGVPHPEPDGGLLAARESGGEEGEGHGGDSSHR